MGLPVKDYRTQIALVVAKLELSNGRLSEPQAAKLIGRSCRRFRAMFREVVGASYRLFRVRIKMWAARRQLVDTDDSIQAVAIKLGYERRDKFENAFKKEFGVTPARFRASPKKCYHMAAQGIYRRGMYSIELGTPTTFESKPARLFPPVQSNKVR